MKSKLTHYTLSTLKIISISSLTIFTLYSAQAVWTPPPQSAPNGNVGGPLTTATTSQVKTGGLGLMGGLSVSKLVTALEGMTVIGTTTTTRLKVTNGAGEGRVLVSDANGDASWVATSSLGIVGGGAAGGPVGVGCGGDGKYLQDIIANNTSHGSITKTTGTSYTKTFTAGEGIKYFVLQGKGNTAMAGSNCGSGNLCYGGGASYAKEGSTWLVVAGGGGGNNVGGDFGSKNSDGSFGLKLAKGMEPFDVSGGGCDGYIEFGGKGWYSTGGAAVNTCAKGVAGPSNDGASITGGSVWTDPDTGQVVDGTYTIEGGKGNAGRGGLNSQTYGGGGGGYGGGSVTKDGGVVHSSGGGSYVNSKRGWLCEGGVYFSTADFPGQITIGSSAGGRDGFAKIIW